MATWFYNQRRVKAPSVNHDGEQTKYAIVLSSHRSNLLTGTNTLPHFDVILLVKGVNRFQSVIMTNDDDVAILGRLARKTHDSGEHSQHNIALHGGNFKREVVLQRGLSHR